jgi:hypothetical protein
MLDAKPALTAKQASAAALAGTLPGAGAQLEPFGPCPSRRARHRPPRDRRPRSPGARQTREGRQQRQRRRHRPTPTRGTELDRAREQVRRAKMSGAERAKALREIALTAQTIARVERDLTGETTEQAAPSTEPKHETRTKQRTEADDLARAARKRAQTEQQDHPPTHRARDSPPSPDHSNQQHRPRDGFSRARARARLIAAHGSSVA